MACPINPRDIVPGSSRRVSSEFRVYPVDLAGTVFCVSQSITWKTVDGDWDGTFHDIERGLSEAEARSLAERLTVSLRPADAVAA